MWWHRKGRLRGREITPDEIFLDSSNRAGLDAHQFEGRVERPVSPVSIAMVGVIFAVATFGFAAQAFNLQVVQGDTFAEISRNNRIDRSVIFATRGIILDRNGKEIAWNEIETDPNATTSSPYPLRSYIKAPGFAHILGFVRYPKTDSSGKWWREEYVGVAGIESLFNTELAGLNGSTLSETDARGGLVREDIVDPAQDGAPLRLSIDADIQSELARRLTAHAETQRFQGGAAVVLDVETGELIALVSFPEYDANAFAGGDVEKVSAVNQDPATPLLNRAVGGLYAPGSIVKPMFAAAALNEGLIDPEKKILSTGSISIPNPYFPDKPSIFRDWKAHGWTDMRRAIAVSSDVYFYSIGGGFQDQKGLGIAKIDEYAKRFGFSLPTGILLGNEPVGTIPTPEWKEEVFGDPWRLGDTYNTAIGQYGFQVTPLQVVRYVAALANGGKLLTPQLMWDLRSPTSASVGISDAHLQIVREGMRAAVTDGGTAAALNIDGLSIAGKTGTAQIGRNNEFMNSWVIGFWPYEKPKYAFAVVLEKAPAGTLSGASPAMSQFFYWLRDNKPEYLQ
ncbi:MAG: penicillin-binding transpeptidase domain-containing protein [Minisyncoccia bacterium]